MKWVLLFVVFSTGSTGQLAGSEIFNTKAACDAAAEWLEAKKFGGDRYAIMATCIKDGE